MLNGITPSSSFDRDKDIAYGELPRQTMDIYRAAEPVSDAPVIMFVYGGGWTRGSKGMYKFAAEGFTQQGYDVVVPDYRLYPDSRYPDMITDTGAAVLAAAERFPDRDLVLIGHSAGGYNVLMTALAPDLSGVDACDRIAGIISLAAPTGAYPMTDEPYLTIFPDHFKGDDAPMARTVDALPPVMLVNGREDETVGYKNASALGERLTAQGLVADVRIYDDMNHIDPVRVLSRYFDGGSTLKDDIVTFVQGLPDRSARCDAKP
ncbi:carboxylesterase [Algimonas porphyrae]|uniref:Carboxylesterase n=1 Tax=Algimonas porphyrae TaxID=1128113 RepID=A0ABQ5UWM9_9PROT|nr:carboxylesterase [Algimonas porphyrae]